MYKELQERKNKILEKKVAKEIIFNEKKCISLVSEKTIKDLYNRIYKLLALEFDEELIKENLKIEKDYTELETLVVNLYVGNNKSFKFMPLEENNKKIMYYRVSSLGNNETNSSVMLKNNNSMIYTEDEVLDTFEQNEFGVFKEGKYLELKNDKFENRMYKKARNHYMISEISKEGWNKISLFNTSYFESNLMAANKYLDEILQCDINDKEFLVEVYTLKFNILYRLGKDQKYEYLKKAIEINPTNQNVLVTALRQMAVEFKNSRKANLIFLLDYLVEYVDYVEADRKSILYGYMASEIIDDNILNASRNKKFRETQLYKLVKIYEVLFRKIKESDKEYSDEIAVQVVGEFLSELKSYQK